MSTGPSTLVSEARQLVRQKEYDAAITALRNGLENDQDDRTAQEMLGVLLFRLKRHDEAADAFRQLTRMAPRDAGAWVNLGAVLNVLQDYRGASDALRKAIQRDKTCGVAYYNLAIAQKGQNQPKMAVSAYEECLRLEPANSEAAVNLGNVLLELKNYRKAIKIAETALENTPKSAKLKRLLAQAEAGAHGSKVDVSPFGRLVNEEELAASQKKLSRRELSVAERNREREFMRELTRELRHAVRPMVPILEEAVPRQLHTLHMAAARKDARNEGIRAYEGLVTAISELAEMQEAVSELSSQMRAQLHKTDPGL